MDGGDYKVYSGGSYGERYGGSGAGGGYGACTVGSYGGSFGGGHSYDGHDGYCGYNIVEERIYQERGEGTYRKVGDEGSARKINDDIKGGRTYLRHVF